MKILIFILGIGLGLCTHLFKKDMTEAEIINRMELQTLRDYKRAYLDHVEMCDTLHVKCFKIGE